MHSKLLHESRGERTFAIVLDTGDEVMETLRRFAGEQRLSGSHFTAIGAFRDAVVSWFDFDAKQYRKIPIREQVEVLALAGDVATNAADGKPVVHAHVVLGRWDGSTRGGHLHEAHVRPTLEVTLSEMPVHLRRTVHDESGLALIDLNQPQHA